MHIVKNFENGYGISVIDNGIGSQAGLLELAVLHYSRLCFRTPITSNVHGWLTQKEVDILSKRVEALPKDLNCNHGFPEWNKEKEKE